MVTGMKYVREGQDLPFWLLGGWILAAVLGNRLFASGILSFSALYESLQQGWQKLGDREWLSVLRLLIIRTAEFLAAAGLCRSRLREAGLRLLLAGYGLSSGFLLILLTWSRGLWGLLLFLAAEFPQGCFEMLFLLCICYRFGRHHAVKHRRFMLALLLIFLAGIASEIWINPMIMKKM